MSSLQVWDLSACWKSLQDVLEGRRQSTSDWSAADLKAALSCSLHRMQTLKQPFIEALHAAGWDTEKVVIEAKRQRAVW